MKAANDQIIFEYHVEGEVANSSLIIALVQKTAESKIRGGENAGRTLSNVQFTFAIETIKLSEKNSGTWPINIPSATSPKCPAKGR